MLNKSCEDINGYSIPTGLIVGIIFGVLAFVCIIGVVTFLVVKSYLKDKKKTGAGSEQEQTGLNA